MIGTLWNGCLMYGSTLLPVWESGVYHYTTTYTATSAR
jgi:hypothetical protein